MLAKNKDRETKKFLCPFLFVIMLFGLLLYRRCLKARIFIHILIYKK